MLEHRINCHDLALVNKRVRGELPDGDEMLDTICGDKSGGTGSDVGLFPLRCSPLCRPLCLLDSGYLRLLRFLRCLNFRSPLPLLCK